jgi:hypothetical protein
MTSDAAIEGAEQYRLMLLVEHLQRQGKSEGEIIAAVREATNKEAASVSES